MKIWIVCDNNVKSTIIAFETLEKAQKYVDKYDGCAAEDCWIFDENGSEIRK